MSLHERVKVGNAKFMLDVTSMADFIWLREVSHFFILSFSLSFLLLSLFSLSLSSLHIPSLSLSVSFFSHSDLLDAAFFLE